MLLTSGKPTERQALTSLQQMPVEQLLSINLKHPGNRNRAGVHAKSFYRQESRARAEKSAPIKRSVPNAARPRAFIRAVETSSPNIADPPAASAGAPSPDGTKLFAAVGMGQPPPRREAWAKVDRGPTLKFSEASFSSSAQAAVAGLALLQPAAIKASATTDVLPSRGNGPRTKAAATVAAAAVAAKAVNAVPNAVAATGPLATAALEFLGGNGAHVPALHCGVAYDISDGGGAASTEAEAAAAMKAAPVGAASGRPEGGYMKSPPMRVCVSRSGCTGGGGGVGGGTMASVSIAAKASGRTSSTDINPRCDIVPATSASSNISNMAMDTTTVATRRPTSAPAAEKPGGKGVAFGRGVTTAPRIKPVENWAEVRREPMDHGALATGILLAAKCHGSGAGGGAASAMVPASASRLIDTRGASSARNHTKPGAAATVAASIRQKAAKATYQPAQAPPVDEGASFSEFPSPPLASAAARRRAVMEEEAGAEEA